MLSRPEKTNPIRTQFTQKQTQSVAAKRQLVSKVRRRIAGGSLLKMITDSFFDL